MEELESLLGKKAKDKVTGVTGIVTGVCRYLYGNDKICIGIEGSKDGLDIWNDFDRIEILN